MLVTALLFALSLADPASAQDETRSAHDRVTEETGLTFSVAGSLLRRSIISTDTAYGFAVRRVRAGSRAARAGIAPGDILMKWDGRPVRTLETLAGWIDEEEAGADVAIEVSRRKAHRRPFDRSFDRKAWVSHDLSIRVGRPSLFVETGIDVSFLDSWWRRKGSDRRVGFKIGQVRLDSPASRAGLRAGDLLLEWKGRPIKSFAQLEQWLEEDLPGGSIEVGYARRVGGKFSFDPWDERSTSIMLSD